MPSPQSAPGSHPALTGPALTGPARQALSKVPQATALFWVIKVLTTGMGETASDSIGNSAVWLAAPLVVLTVVALVTAFVRQFRADRYVAGIYWFAIVMVSIVGTMLSDGSRIALGISYTTSTVAFVIALTVVFTTWWRSERTLSIHSIYTRRRETFYWCAVVATFALGTSTGDWTAQTWHLGYLGSGLMFIGIILVPLVLHKVFGLNAILAFWWAYVTTRPLGASFADYMAVPKHAGGLGWGTWPVTGGLAAIILVLIGYLIRSHRDLIESLDVDVEPRPGGLSRKWLLGASGTDLLPRQTH